MAILNLYGVPFHLAVVFGLGYDFLFKSLLGHCGPVDPCLTTIRQLPYNCLVTKQITVTLQSNQQIKIFLIITTTQKLQAYEAVHSSAQPKNSTYHSMFDLQLGFGPEGLQTLVRLQIQLWCLDNEKTERKHPSHRLSMFRSI